MKDIGTKEKHMESAATIKSKKMIQSLTRNMEFGYKVSKVNG